MSEFSKSFDSNEDSLMPNNNNVRRLVLVAARLQAQLMVEKESRLLEMAARHEAQREGTIQRVTRSSGSSLSSSLSSIGSTGGQGRVRKLFEERRSNGYNHSPVGWDKSYPLEPVRGGGSGGSGGRPPPGGGRQMKGVVRNNRGVSVDRAPQYQETTAMKRSRSHATLQRPVDPRSPPRNLRPPIGRTLSHHKSTSSLLDANQNYSGGRGSSGSSSGIYSREHSRDTSPASSPPPPANRFGYRANSRDRSSSRGPSPSPPLNRSPRKSINSLDPQRNNTITRNNHMSRQSSQESMSMTNPKPSSYQYQQNKRNRIHKQCKPKQTPRTPSMPLDQPAKPIARPVETQQKRGGLFNGSPATTRVEDVVDSPPKPPLRSKPKPPLKPKPQTRVANTPTPMTQKPSQQDVPLQDKPVPKGMAKCKICGRNFNDDRIEKHVGICAKSAAKAKKKKVYDPAKMRTKGTEAEKYVARGEHLKEHPKPKKVDWRKKHEDFIATVRAAKGIEGYEAPPMDTSDYVQCPHCGRKFNEGVADRHIPKCSSIKSNK
ncbi:unnamed protein product, partial [Meganyctiphanes norvegica]